MGYSPWGHKESDATERTHVYSWVLKRLEINCLGNGPSQMATVMTQGHYAPGRGRPGCWKRKNLRAFAVGLAVHITGGLQQGPCGVDVIKPKSPGQETCSRSPSQ